MATPEDRRWVGRAAVTPASRSRHTNAPVEPHTGTTTRPRPAAPAGSARAPGPPGAGGPRRHLRPRWGRVALVFAVALTMVIGLISVAAVLWARNLDERLKRTDPFSQIA